ncbi:hypothetical protein BSLG_005773 [Batrachochytrium salamandrivorans]|nr:hypothetical protein BSLG_005773 [Batrachochytrium salamandrivorans]
MQIQYSTTTPTERVISFDAHADFIRMIAVHHTLPYLISASDDYLSNFGIGKKAGATLCNTFASASMDRTIKIWSLGSRVPNYTLDRHKSGVNCLDYYHGSDKPYLVSGADDKTVKIWDYQNKSCVQTLDGHTNNVSIVCFHPELPIIVSGSEDGTVRIWHANTYRLENTLNYGMERTSNIKASGEEVHLEDGEQVILPVKDLGSCEIYPQTLQQSEWPRQTIQIIQGKNQASDPVMELKLFWRTSGYTVTFDNNMYLLGYIPRDNRIYICDKNLAVMSYSLPLSLIEYQTAVIRNDMEHAARVLPSVPVDQHNRIARFLEGRGLKEEALHVSTDTSTNLNWRVHLDTLILRTRLPRQPRMIKSGRPLAMLRFLHGKRMLASFSDFEGLLMIYQTSGNATGLAELATMAVEAGSNNIAFVCFLLLVRPSNVLIFLIHTGRIPEAALFARTYNLARSIVLLRCGKHLWKVRRRRDRGLVSLETRHTPSPNRMISPIRAAQTSPASVSNAALFHSQVSCNLNTVNLVLLFRINQRHRMCRLRHHPPHPTLLGKTHLTGIATDDRPDGLSDSLSHLSLDVNTTGTGSHFCGDMVEILVQLKQCITANDDLAALNDDEIDALLM